MPPVVQFVILVLAIVGVLALIILFLPDRTQRFSDEPFDPSFFTPPPEPEEHVYIIHFVDNKTTEMRLAQIQVGPQFVAFHRADGTLAAAYATPNIQSITEK